MMVSRHGYRVLWPLACTVIHSGAIKSDVTQTWTEERYVGIHAHLSLPLTPFCLLSLPPFSVFLLPFLLFCARPYADASAFAPKLPARRRSDRPTSSRVFDAGEIAAYFEPGIKAGTISISLQSAKFPISVVNIIRRSNMLKSIFCICIVVRNNKISDVLNPFLRFQ